jgi:hypothetical protein
MIDYGLLFWMVVYAVLIPLLYGRARMGALADAVRHIRQADGDASKV